MFEICLKRGWSIPTRAALDLCKMVDKRLCVLSILLLVTAHISCRWASNTPLRQFRGVPADVIRKAEGKQFVSPPTIFTTKVLKFE